MTSNDVFFSGVIMSNENHRISLRTNENIYLRLKKLSNETKASINSLILLAIIKFLKENGL